MIDETPEQRLARLLMGQGGDQTAASPQGLADALVQPPRNPAAPADWAQNAVRGVAGKLADIVMAPRRAMDQGMTTEEAVPWAADTAMTMAGGASPFSAPGALGAAGGKLMQPEGIRAYHVSPHDYVRPDISKIGTGEGAQSYGHGLYGAESKGVRDQYWNQFASRMGLEIGSPEYKAARANYEADGDLTKAFSELQQERSLYSGRRPDLERAMDIVQSGKIPGPRTYEWNINAKPEQFLDWDKPLAGQAPNAQESVKQAMGIDYYGKFDPAKSQRIWEEVQHANAGTAVKQGFIAGDDAVVSQRLRDAGIPGIKYLDQGSRIPVRQAQDEIGRWQAQLPKAQADLDAAMRQGASQRTIAELQGEVKRVQDGIERVQSQTEGTSNYVLFDDKLIDILRKYGLAGAAPSTAALAEALSKQQGVASQ